MALLYYYQEQADPIILETGLGGRLDATNIVSPWVTVITNIHHDHHEHLGSDLLQIAAEKAGIIKPAAPLVTYATQKSVLELFRRRCQELAAPLYQGGVDFKTRGRGGGWFDYHGLEHDFKGLRLNLRGRHQYRNAALALAVLEILARQGLDLSETAIREGLPKTYWPGRLEQVAQDSRVILDGAHNPAAAQSLAQALKRSRGNSRLILVLGVMADKDVDGILARLLPLAQLVIFTQPRYFRAAATADLLRRAEAYGLPALSVPVVADAIQQAQSLARPHDRILISGSLFTVGEAKQYFAPAASVTAQPVRG